MYKCKYCGQPFETKNLLGGHSAHCELNPKTQEVHICDFCGLKIVSRKSYTQHIRHCKNNPYAEPYRFTESLTYNEGGSCKYCAKWCKNANSLRNHQRLCKLNPEKPVANIRSGKKGGWPKGRPGWSKGLTKDTDPRVRKCSEKLKEHYIDKDGTFKGKHHTLETRLKLSETAKNRDYAANYRASKRILYKDVYFESTYEVELAKDLESNEINWSKPKRFKYKDLDGNFHYYTPDLYLPDYDIYLDPKNDFLIENINPHFGYKDVDKIRWVMEQNNVKIIILNKDQLCWTEVRKMIENS